MPQGGTFYLKIEGTLCSPYPSYSVYLYGTSYNEIRACESVNNLLCYTLLSLIRVRTNSEDILFEEYYVWRVVQLSETEGPYVTFPSIVR